MKPSEKIINQLRTMQYWKTGLNKATSCWSAEKAGITYTAEESTKMHEAARLFRQAETIVKEIYSKKIGDAIVSEVS